MDEETHARLERIERLLATMAPAVARLAMAWEKYEPLLKSMTEGPAHMFAAARKARRVGQ